MYVYRIVYILYIQYICGGEEKHIQGFGGEIGGKETLGRTRC
jgi:hypothetical protein